MRLLPLTVPNRYRQGAAWLSMLFSARSRRRLHRQFQQSGRYPIAVLFYHRVADRYPNPWSISRRDFARHLDWMESHFDVVSLAEARRRIISPANHRPTVSITFDDGYAENCDFAIPELQRRQLPATYFVATDHVACGAPFAHDMQRGQPLAPNSVSELQDIQRAGVEIGAHTRSHCDLGSINCPTHASDEICGSIAQLNAWNLGPIRYFSFPYGLPENCSQLAIDLLHKQGIEVACTAYGAWNWPGSTGFHIRRIHADPGIQTLKRWLTLDPRKLNDRQRLPFVEPGGVASPLLNNSPQPRAIDEYALA